MAAKNPLANDLDEIVAQVSDLLEELRGQSVFVTGGTGFFGTWLLETLAWVNSARGLKIDVLVLSRNPDRFVAQFPHLIKNGIRFCQGDVESFEFPQGQFPYFFHGATAASAKLNQESPLVMFDQVLNGTRRVLEFAKTHGAKKFLLTSSGGVYGKQPGQMTHVSEDYPGAPDPMDFRSAYSEAKRAAEFYCATYSRECGFEVKIARCFAFVGPHLPLDTHFAVGNFIRDGLAGHPIQIGGDGTPYRSYLYASELIVWLLTIWLKGRSCRPYNLGSEDGRPLAEIAQKVSEQFSGLAVSIAKKAAPDQVPERYVPSVARALQELGLSQKISLEESLKRTISFHRLQSERHQGD